MKKEKHRGKLLIKIFSGAEAVVEILVESYLIELNDLPTMALSTEQETAYEKVPLADDEILW